MNPKRFMPYCTLLLVVLASSLALWIPSIMRGEALQIYSQFDGPLYIIPAKTLYDPGQITALSRDSVIPANPLYFAAHLPLYPLMIRMVAPLFGHLKAMLMVSVGFSVLLAWVFYYLVRRFHLTKHPVLLTGIMLFLPRLLVVRSTGAPESMFMALILLSLLFFEKSRYWWAALFGALATATKVPGVLLFGAYALVFAERYLKTKKIEIAGTWIFLIPLSLIAVFFWYARQYGDFFAFFHTGGSVPMPYPFAVFNFQAKWVGTAWLEDIVFYFFLYGLTTYQLKNSRHRSFFYFALIFSVSLLFVQHRDISRYGLPLWPLAIIAFEQFFISDKFKFIFGVMLAGIYLYAWNFLAYNVMPITEWLPFL